MRQILVNLLGNAIKFTDSGEVVLRVENIAEEKDKLSFRIGVEDTGIGIEPNLKKHIFDVFSQADSSTTRKYGGTGLGLAISRQLVELMEGEIFVESKLGQGSTFWFTVTFSCQPDVKKKHSQKTMDNLLGVRLLIVDDNATNREIMETQVQSWGVTCAVAENGTQALQLLRKAVAAGEPYDIALLDWHMPEMDGVELAREIRTDQAIKNICLIMLSSSSFNDQAAQAIEVGVNQYLAKPVRQNLLFEALTSQVAKYKNKSMDYEHQLADVSSGELGFDADVLLVEDNLINQDVCREMLRKLECRVDVAENGREAVEALSKRKYDIVLMDCHMPEMDGFEATKQIRRNEIKAGKGRVPIVALTGDVRIGIRDQCQAVGMDDYLSKPFYLAELQYILESFLTPIIIIKEERQEEPELASASEEVSLLESFLDQDRLDMIRGLQRPGRPNVLKKIIHLYQKNSPTLVQSIRDAVSNGDSTALQEAAHSLKSASANLGAVGLAELCKQIEEIGYSGQPGSAGELLDNLEKLFQEALDALLVELEKIPDE